MHGPEFDVEYNVDGKPITPLNALNRGDGLDMLDVALGMYSEQKAVLQNDFANTFDLSIVRVKLAESHVAMADGPRMALLEKMQRAIAGHFRKYHPEDRQTLMFHSPAGGGWVSDNGQKPARFEVDKTMERP